VPFDDVDEVCIIRKNIYRPHKDYAANAAGLIEAIRELYMCREHAQPSVRMQSPDGPQCQRKIPLLGVMSRTATQQ
jgi:hypothetical protein